MNTFDLNAYLFKEGSKKGENIMTNEKQVTELNELLQNPETAAALAALVANLPKLTEMTNALTKAYDFANSVATDDTLKNDTVAAITEMATPVVDGAKSVARNAIEAKDRAEKSTETIGVFGLMKMLKDPQVQGVLRFANAFLQVSAEQKAKK